MRYFVPDLLPGSPGANEAYPERLGGLPMGLADAAWPKCAECGRSQSFLAQFCHDAERLDLGREGRSLLVFQCNFDPGMCDTWEAFSGANACLIVEPEDLGDEETAWPADMPPVENCALIVGWLERDDHLNREEASQFFSEKSFFTLDEDVLRKPTWSTRMGGVPRWLQSPAEAPKPDWHFIGQLDSSYSFIRAPECELHWISADTELFEGRTHTADGPNFGDGGIAYLFAKDEGGSCRVVMLSQST